MFNVALTKKFGLLDPKLAWFNAHIAPIIKNDEASIHWNIKMVTHTTVDHRWPDLRVEWKKKQMIEVFDMACPLDCNVIEKEKTERLQPVVLRLTKTIYHTKRHIHPLVIGATGKLHNIKKEVTSVIKDSKITDSIVREMQTTVVVHTQQIIHRILTGSL